MAGKRNKAKTQEQSLVDTTEGKHDTKKGGKKDSKTNPKMIVDEEKVWLPGMTLDENEELEADPSAYIMLHELNLEWPCLSFDVVRDAGGEERTAFPMSSFFVTGTQADEAKNNELVLVYCGNLTKTFVNDEEDEEGETDEEEESEEGEDGQTNGNEHKRLSKDSPHYHCISIPHHGAINRIRSCNIRGDMQNVLVASWSEMRCVNIWSLKESLETLSACSQTLSDSSWQRRNVSPLYTTKIHRNEGFALDWSPLLPGLLLSGDCDGTIYQTSILGDSRPSTDNRPFHAHKGSIEDLQWSPSESTLFASSSTDHTVRIWDVRQPRSDSALVAKLHDCDINVISWNRHSSHLLASGADDGNLAIWDLRSLASSTSQTDGRPQPYSQFNWHQKAITSVEWSPQDPSILAASGADDQLTIWDLAVTSSKMEMMGKVQVPPQLLFIHQGQREIKELHWHPQLSGVLLSTSLSGFNIFKTISV